MPLYNSPQAYVFNLQTTSSAEAKRLWRSKIKEEWDWECAYCGSDENFAKNVLCGCHECNNDKGHKPVEDGYISQEFFNAER